MRSLIRVISLITLLAAGPQMAKAQCYYQSGGTANGGVVDWYAMPQFTPPAGCYPITITAGLNSAVNLGPGSTFTYTVASPSSPSSYHIVGVADWSHEGTSIQVTGIWQATCNGPFTPFASGWCNSYYYYMDQLEPEAFSWSLQAGCTGGTQRLMLTDQAGDPGNLVNAGTAAGADYQLKLNSTVIASGALSTRYVSSPPSLSFDALAPGAYDLIITASTTTSGFAYWDVPGAWPRFVIPTQGDCGINLPVRVMLDGAAPLSGTSTLMRDDLRAAGVLPLAEPYTALGYTYVGSSPGSTIAPALLTVTGVNAVVDWVVVELRSAADPSVVVESRAALLQRDGEVMDVNGEAWVNFSAPPGTYHVAVLHRNHLGVRTATAVACGPSAFGVDFTRTGIAYGTAPTKTNQYLGQTLWSGDATSNGSLKYTGSGNDRDPILLAVGSTTPNNTVSNVYDRRDTNLDGVIKYTGTGNDRDIILTNVGSTTPNNTRTQQLP
jgi:hypothetical protein